MPLLCLGCYSLGPLGCLVPLVLMSNYYLVTQSSPVPNKSPSSIPIPPPYILCSSYLKLSIRYHCLLNITYLATIVYTKMFIVLYLTPCSRVALLIKKVTANMKKMTTPGLDPLVFLTMAVFSLHGCLQCFAVERR